MNYLNGLFFCMITVGEAALALSPGRSFLFGPALPGRGGILGLCKLWTLRPSQAVLGKQLTCFGLAAVQLQQGNSEFFCHLCPGTVFEEPLAAFLPYWAWMADELSFLEAV